MYLDDVAAAIRRHVPADRMPAGNVRELFLLYAVLARARGTKVTLSDVHDAWSAWMAKRDKSHASLVPFADLPDDVKQQDQAFADAIRLAAEELGLEGSQPAFREILFPLGPPNTSDECKQALELYKIMVQSSESLVNRRQAVNTFFLTMNGALLTASGLIVQLSSADRYGALGVAVLTISGMVLCAAWRSLIVSFGQLNRGKFKVINAVEPYLKTAVYAAEWEALGRGENPDIYRSFTSREIWVPNALFGLHSIATVVAILVFAGIISLESQSR